ncbi:hypothetical protein OAV62_01315 [bacterium]|nr:hypothetical protein [bacterium]
MPYNQTYYRVNKERGQKYRETHKEELREYHKRHYEKNREDLIAYAKKQRDDIRKDIIENGLSLPNITEKRCSKCSVIQTIDNFGILRTKNTYQSHCKTCRNLKGKMYRVTHKIIISEQRKRNKKPLTEKQKINISLRRRLVNCVQGIHTSKTSKALEFLKCSKKVFYEWLMYNLDIDNMKFSDFGNDVFSWHMDHVIPCASFNLLDTTDQKHCFHWSNIKPMLKEKNLSKADKIVWSVLFEQELRLRLFVKKRPELLGGVLATADLMKIRLQQQV